MMMTPLVASLLVLGTGPLVAALAGRRPKLWQLLDGFVLTVVVGLVVLHVLPNAVATAGAWALPVAIAGLAMAPRMEAALARLGSRSNAGFALGAAILVLASHAFLDGLALAQADTDPELGLAVVLHRLPMAVAVWWLGRPIFGRPVTLGLLGVLGIATVAGFAGNAPMLGEDTIPAALLRALVAGGLLHVVLAHARHGHEHACDHGTSSTGSHQESWQTGLGALLGLGSMVAMSLNDHGHDHGHDSHGSAAEGIWHTFTELALTTAPALLLGFVAAGLLHALLPTIPRSWMTGGNSLSQAARGMAFGLPLPLCSCGVLPTYRTLITQRTPAPAAMAFLIATPEIGIDAITISIPLLGWPITLARLLSAAVLALLVGAWVGRDTPMPDAAPSCGSCSAASPSAGGRVIMGLKTAATDIVDHTAPWVLAGLILAALAEPLLSLGWLKTLPAWSQVPIFALIGIPVYVCATGATPLVAVFLATGVSPGAAVAFLLTGPATNISTFGILSDLHGRSTAKRFAVAVTAVAVALGWIIDASMGTGASEVPAHHHHDPSTLSLVCLGILGLLVAGSILRRGPRTFVGQVLETHH